MKEKTPPEQEHLRLPAAAASAIREALGNWFARNRRDLPWRKKRTPYRVWISEIMLQQTRADQALPYFNRFMKRFPTLAALAEAPRQDVLKAWEGLGYYSRARNMHETACLLLREHGGRFPRTHSGLLGLPGIGPYSAAAIASLAMNLPHAVVDGNVIRVLARLFLVEAQFDTPEGKRRKVPHIHVGAGIITDSRNRLLIAQRRDADMLGGLWEFPGGKRETGESNEACIRRELEEEMGILTRVGPPLMTVHHAYSHFTIDLHAHWARIEHGRPRPIECAAVQWVSRKRLDDFPMSRADDHIRQRVRKTPAPPF